MQGVGLVSDHAYSIISAFEFDHQGEPLKLLKLRNPWGHQEWSGDWSDQSPKWTPQLRDKLGMRSSDDGVFFIAFHDYINYYRSTTICRVHDGYHYKSIEVDTTKAPFNTQKTYQIVNISLKEKSKIFFTVH